MDSHQVDPFKHRQKKMLPRYIPQEVLNQLNHHLDSLPVQIKRMVILLQECGMRLRELCSLSFDCLDLDASGNWSLRYYSSKINEEYIIPVSDKVATTIIEQQKALLNERGEVIPFLFPDPKGQPFSQKNFQDTLNCLAYENAIRDTFGTIWSFRGNQFRYTFFKTR